MRVVGALICLLTFGCAEPSTDFDVSDTPEMLFEDANILEMPGTDDGSTPLTNLTGPESFQREMLGEEFVLRRPSESEPEDPNTALDVSEDGFPDGWQQVEHCELPYDADDFEITFADSAQRRGAGMTHEPLPNGTWRWSDFWFQSHGVDRDMVLADLVMPNYNDDWSVFQRATAWESESRCYELPPGHFLLTQSAAYDLWVRMVRETLWLEVDQTPGIRTVIGLRGAVPGSLIWHGNPKNRFNDAIVLLWRDENNQPHVREFPMTADPGTYGFPENESSALYPNRHYPYINGWHRGYNALSIVPYGYRVRDDTNKNGHWDDDRNGWLDGGAEDRFRGGSGHNIHMAAPSRGIQSQRIHNWSAGCQVIPGVQNWMEFIGHAWTGPGDQVDYFLLDARDVADSVWTPCNQERGTHRCPHPIRELPVALEGDTSAALADEFDLYNCSSANESGPEYVYVLNLREEGTLRVSVETDDVDADPDIHLLSGDDQNACLVRAHESFQYESSPGRYLLIVDSWVNGEGVTLDGAYRLNVALER